MTRCAKIRKVKHKWSGRHRKDTQRSKAMRNPQNSVGSLYRSIRLLRYILPITAFLLVVVHQSLTFAWLRPTPPFPYFLAQVLLYGTVGPILVWLALTWFLRWAREREEAEVHLHCLNQISRQAATATEMEALADIALKMPEEIISPVASSLILREHPEGPWTLAGTHGLQGKEKEMLGARLVIAGSDLYCGQCAALSATAHQNCPLQIPLPQADMLPSITSVICLPLSTERPPLALLNIYLFDEPSSYLDVKQRIAASRAIRNLKKDGKMVVVAEHDLAVLDYLSDHICILYGEPGVYGVVSSVYGVKVGINRYLDGYLPDENIRFRDDAIQFKIKPPITTLKNQNIILKWNEMKKSYDDFTLTTDSGVAHKGEVIGIVGPNGIGKTTFVKMLAGIEKPDSGNTSTLDGGKISYKPQYISVSFNDTVENLLKSISKNDFYSSWYRSEVLQPLNIETILDRNVNALSGGELQRTAIAACLSNPASIYLLDEPSAYLDVEERLVMTRTIRRKVENRGVTAFMVDHDIVTQDFVVDRIMIFQGEQGYRGHAKFLASLRESMNSFLKEMNITFRRDTMTGRPRVNKEDSKLDRYQKEIGEYYYEPKLEEDT